MTIKDFIDKKIAIAFTSPEQIKEFAKMCEGHGLKMCIDHVDACEWMRHRPDILFNSIVTHNNVVHFAYNFAKEKIGYGLSWHGDYTVYVNHGWKIVPFEDFKGNSKTTSRYKIVIECNGDDVTTAEMIVNGKVVKVGKAKRNPEDKFDFATGAKMAFERMFAKKPKEEKNGVSRHAKVGETIKIVKPSGSRGYYEKGDTFKVEKVDADTGSVKVHLINPDEHFLMWGDEPDTACIWPEEYVVME